MAYQYQLPELMFLHSVSEYKYLGLLVRRDLNIDVVAKGRLEKAEKTYRTIYPYLRCASIPLAARVAVSKAVVVTTALYGSLKSGA